MAIIRSLLFIYALIGIFIAGGLFFKKKSLVNTFITLFVGFLSIELLEFLYSTSRMRLVYPDVAVLVYHPIGFLYGPILWIHITLLSDEKLKLTWKDCIHLVPFLTCITILTPIYVLPAVDRLRYLSEHFYDFTMPINYARAAHQFLYGLALIIYIYRQRFFINARKKMYEIALVFIYMISKVLISWLTQYATGWRDFALFYIVIYTLVILLGYLLYADPDFLKDLRKKYLNSGLGRNDMQRIYAKIKSAFFEDKVYLQGDINLNQFALAINEKPHHISQTMSQYVKRNFNEHLNYHRIEHATALLKNPNFQHYKIEAIALESGFNNKVTFNKAFLKYTGVTPSSYRAAISN